MAIKFNYDTSITDADLNNLQNQNGSGTVNSDGITPIDKQGRFMTGALAPFKIPNTRNIYLNANFNQNDLKINDEWLANKTVGELSKLWFYNQFYTYLNASIELINYDNLPASLNKYELEYALRWNGIAGIIKFKKKYYVVTIDDFDMPEETRFNYAYLPQYVSLNENDPLAKIKFFKKVKFEVGKDIVLIRNNLSRLGFYILTLKYFVELQNLFNYFESNNLASIPKAIVIDDLSNDEKQQDFWNTMAYSKLPFHNYQMDIEYLSALKIRGYDKPFIPINFENQTRQLVENFNWLKEQIKELFGFDTLNLNGKKERVLNAEIGASSSLASFNLTHQINIRNNDFRIFNQLFKEKVKVGEAKNKSEMINLSKDVPQQRRTMSVEGERVGD